MTPTAAPLCASCAHASVPWPHDFTDVQSHDRCGAGWLTAGRTVHQCFSYAGDRAELVTYDFSPKVADVDWQDRVDGMTIRKPK